jgi:L-amino acid N-acyltransferase YncA
VLIFQNDLENIMLTIIEAKPEHYDAIWDIFHRVVKTGDTYVYPPETTKKEALDAWCNNHLTTFVALDNDVLVGTYVIKPNFPGLGSHTANCSYMVSDHARGMGVGKAMCQHSLEYAKKKGYIGMQFNMVVSNNEPAVQLWLSLGFTIIGTTPRGFKHQDKGYVDTYIMYREL